MIAGIKTASEARADALAYQTINSAPNSIGVKIFNNFLLRLMEYQKENPTALTVTVPVSFGIIIPTAAISTIQSIWGYTITAVTSPPPSGYKGSITQWSRVTKIDW